MLDRINFIVLIIWLVVVIRCAPSNCGSEQNTPLYKSVGTSNGDNFYFVPETFKSGPLFDPCTPITATSQFRQSVNNNIRCKGQWCGPLGDFSCSEKGIQISKYLT